MLSHEERETVICYDMKNKVAVVTTCIPKDIRRLTKLHGPGEKQDEHGTERWEIPAKFVRFIGKAAPRTEAQIAAAQKMADRLKLARKGPQS